jgi:soluble lytic murein transglycosylase-like protein
MILFHCSDRVIQKYPPASGVLKISGRFKCGYYYPFLVNIIAGFFSLVIFLHAGVSVADKAVYRFKDKDGVWHFSDVNRDERYEVHFIIREENPEVFISKYGQHIEKAAEKFNLKTSLVKAVIMAESGFDPKAVSKKGAQGLMQLMPETANELDVGDPYDPEENILGGTRYLSRLMERFNNDMELAIAAYNAGPEKVDKYNGVPPYEETKTFIKRVMGFYEQYESGK